MHAKLTGLRSGLAGAGCGLEDPGNYVDIDPEVKDVWGIPAARIHLRHGKNQEAMVKDMVQRGVELIEAAGGKVSSYTTSTSIPGAQIHEQGTCRMGNDPKKFVTDRWGKTYDVPNYCLPMVPCIAPVALPIRPLQFFLSPCAMLIILPKKCGKRTCERSSSHGSADDRALCPSPSGRCLHCGY